MAYIIVMVAIATAFINYPIDSLFEILAAPTADAVKVKAADSVMKRVKRQAVTVARRASTAANNAVSTAAALTAKVARKSIAGTISRELPQATKTTKALAVASLGVIAPTANAMHLARTVSRLEMSRSASYKNEYGECEDDDSEYADSDNDDDDCKSDDNSDSGDNDTSAGNDSAARKHALDELFQELRIDITNQRRLLQKSELDNYDNQWGLDPTGRNGSVCS